MDYSERLKNLIKNNDIPAQIESMVEIIILENQIVGMKQMHTGKKGYCSHEANALLFNSQIKLDVLIDNLKLKVEL